MGAVLGSGGSEEREGLCVPAATANGAMGGAFADARCVWRLLGVDGVKSPDLDSADGNGASITGSAGTSMFGLSDGDGDGDGDGADGVVTVIRPAGTLSVRVRTGAD